MTTGNAIRFVCILLLWLGLCWLLLTRAARIDFMVIFTIVASGIIVFGLSEKQLFLQVSSHYW